MFRRAAQRARSHSASSPGADPVLAGHASSGVDSRLKRIELESSGFEVGLCCCGMTASGARKSAVIRDVDLPRHSGGCADFPISSLDPCRVDFLHVPQSANRYAQVQDWSSVDNDSTLAYLWATSSKSPVPSRRLTMILKKRSPPLPSSPSSVSPTRHILMKILSNP